MITGVWVWLFFLHYIHSHLFSIKGKLWRDTTLCWRRLLLYCFRRSIWCDGWFWSTWIFTGKARHRWITYWIEGTLLRLLYIVLFYCIFKCICSHPCLLFSLFVFPLKEFGKENLSMYESHSQSMVHFYILFVIIICKGNFIQDLLKIKYAFFLNGFIDFISIHDNLFF